MMKLPPLAPLPIIQPVQKAPFLAKLPAKPHRVTLALLYVQRPRPPARFPVRVGVRQGVAAIDLVDGDGLGAVAGDLAQLQAAAGAEPPVGVVEGEGAG